MRILAGTPICRHCSSMDFADNIGGVAAEEFMCESPIDVVYTWVNGSDPDFIRRRLLILHPFLILLSATALPQLVGLGASAGSL